MHVVTVGEAKRDLEQVIERVIADAEPALVVTESGEHVVLLSLDEYDAWKETVYLLSNPTNAARLRESIAQARAGQKQERELLD